MKNHTADPDIRYLIKSVSKPNGCATAMPTACELRQLTSIWVLKVFYGLNLGAVIVSDLVVLPLNKTDEKFFFNFERKSLPSSPFILSRAFLSIQDVF